MHEIAYTCDAMGCRFVSVLAALVALVSVSSCGRRGPELPASGAPTTGDVFGGKECNSVRNPLEPVLTAWKSDDRAQITALRQQGVIAVRYAVQGCNVELEVLPNCTGPGKYAFTPSPFKNRDIIERQSELFAELPLGAARLAGEVARDRALRTDYVRVGVASLPSGQSYAPTELRGPDCPRATHVVARIYLGGFAMAAGETSKVRAEASLFGLGGGGRNTSSIKTLFVDGVPEACEQAYASGEESPRCAVPLRVGLLPLAGHAMPECPVGSAWDGARCVRSHVVTQVNCPAGTQWNGSECAARVSTSCGAGFHFEVGKGCLPHIAADPLVAPPADYAIAASELKKWNEFSPDVGANQTARENAQKAMMGYYSAKRNKSEAARYVVHAAYHVAKMKAASGAIDTEKWWKNTIKAWESYKKVAPVEEGRNSAVGSPEATLAAQAEYTLLDQEITKKFDYQSGHHRFKGTPVQVIEAYRRQATVAKGWYEKLQVVIDKYVSHEYTTVAIARQGTLYDSLRTGLYNVRPPELQLFDAKQEALLKKHEEGDQREKVGAIRAKVQQAWLDARDNETNPADEVMVDRYASAIVLSRRYDVSHASVVHAIRRLAFFTEVIGEPRMKRFSAKVKDLNYTEGMFPKMLQAR
ncbi:MAG: hypothetical protein IT348_20240 [Candidatus Eisenbacteria bacterium]|nr:hypothetical protein [Candidatus Eisenbacteria bacterium]